MNTARLPAPLKEASHKLFQATAALRTPQPDVMISPTVSGWWEQDTSGKVPFSRSGNGSETDVLFAPVDDCEAGDESVIRAYLHLAQEDSTREAARFARAADVFAVRVQWFLAQAASVVFETVGDDSCDLPPAPTDDAMRPKLTRWLLCWCEFARLWRVWQRPPLASAARMFSGANPSSPAKSFLSAAQAATVERLTAIRWARDNADDHLPRTVLARWSHPLVVGPSGSGKGFAIRETARRLGLAYGRWEVGAWSVVAGRANRATVEQIERFISTHPQGTLVHLAGVDALAATRISTGDVNVSWWGSVLAEVERSLDWVAERGLAHDGDPSPVRPYVVVSARFAVLWGGHDLGGPAGADAWRSADSEALTGAAAVADWLEREGQMPASLLGRLTSPPLVIERVGPEEAAGLAKTLCATLPPTLDGMLTEGEAAEALSRPESWRALARYVETQLTRIGA